MTEDEVMKDLHKQRVELAKLFDYDVRKMLDYFRNKQATERLPVISLVRRKKSRLETDPRIKVA